MIGWFGEIPAFTEQRAITPGGMPHSRPKSVFWPLREEFFGRIGAISDNLLTRIDPLESFSKTGPWPLPWFHSHFGLFMNGPAHRMREGYELTTSRIGNMTAFLMIRGAGAASVDRLWYSPAANKKGSRPRPAPRPPIRKTSWKKSAALQHLGLAGHYEKA